MQHFILVFEIDRTRNQFAGANKVQTCQIAFHLFVSKNVKVITSQRTYRKTKQCQKIIQYQVAPTKVAPTKVQSTPSAQLSVSAQTPNWVAIGESGCL